ncbi:hypothetical protein M2404_002002 [Rheinheimera pacifica]|uniref:hypothetical protein n=1 Tax=Rheinheimera pacifica TaxID=173990 RepID=UPI0021687CF8|nr:hypothetical protein [Rheinheimera pacifica]MCS4307662.1 hypothetical protein [Rheinheimera pacifica]
MEISSVIEVWKYLKWLPGFILRKIFSKERLADLVLIDVQARHEAVRVNLGEIASYSIYLQVINMSPFDVELDRAEIDFLCAGVSVSKQHIKKTAFKSGEVGSLYITGEIESPKAKQMARYYNENQSSVSFHCEFNCALHNFTKICSNLEGVNVHFANAEWRSSEVEKV